MILARMYAEALEKARASNNTKTPAQILDGLKSVLERRGHSKLLPQILAEYEKLISGKSRTSTTVRVARVKDRAEALKKLSELTGETEATVCEDDKLVSGFVITGKDFRHDQSGRRTLLNLYHRLIDSN